MIEKNYIKINKFIISKNWYELINDSTKKKKLKKICKEKKTIIYLNKDIQLTKSQIIDFSTKENIYISKIYHNNHLILKKNNYQKPTSSIIFFLLIILNLYLHTLKIENLNIKTHLLSHQNLLTNQLSNLKVQKNKLKESFNSTVSLLNQVNCIIESISIKCNKSVTLTVISLKNLITLNHKLNNLDIQPKFINDIGGYYEISIRF